MTLLMNGEIGGVWVDFANERSANDAVEGDNLYYKLSVTVDGVYFLEHYSGGIY